MIFVLFFFLFSSGAFANPLEDDYVGIWHFDEGDSDKTINAITGKEIEKLENYVGWEEGVSGSAVRITDGIWSPAFAEDPTGRLSMSDTETLEMWVYINKFPSTGTTQLVGNERIFSIYPDNHVVYRLFNDEWGYVRSSKKLETGKWIYLAGVHNSTHICLWINGVKDSCAPESRIVKGYGYIKFLLSSGGDDVILDEVRLSKKAFDSEYFGRVYKEGMTGELGPEWNFLTDRRIEMFELPAKEIFLYSWSYDDYYYAGMKDAFQQYATSLNFIYRVLIDSDGKETMLDMHRTHGSRDVVSVTRPGMAGGVLTFFDLPPLAVNFTENGLYRVELRKADFLSPTYTRFPDMQIDSTIDIWSYNLHQGRCAYPWPDSIKCAQSYCSGQTGDSYCFEEKISKDENGVERWNVSAESLAQTLEVYEIEISGLQNMKENEEAAAINPFSISRGDATKSSESSQTDSNSNIPLLFAGATLVSAVALASGSKIRTWVTAEGQRMEESRLAAYRQIELNKIKLAEFERGQAFKKMEEETKIEEENKRNLNEQFQKRTTSLQNALANADRMHTYEQKAKELARIQKDYSDVLSDEKKRMYAAQASWFTKEGERLYASYKEAKALQLSAAQQTTSTSNNSEKTEQTAVAKNPARLQEMKLPIKINKINYGNANKKIDNWLVSNSESAKKVSDGLGWASLGMFIAGAALTATGFGAVAGVPLMAASFGSGAIGGSLDLAVGSARQKAGLANEDDYWRMGFAPLAFIPGLGGAKQAVKQFGKEAGKILGGLIKPLTELAGNSGKIGVVADKAKDIFAVGKKIATETIAAVKNTARDFESKVKNILGGKMPKFVEPTKHFNEMILERKISKEKIQNTLENGKPYFDEKYGHVVRTDGEIAVAVTKTPNDFISKKPLNILENPERAITVYQTTEKKIENMVASGRLKPLPYGAKKSSEIGEKAGKNSYYNTLQKIYGKAPESATIVKNAALDFGSKVKIVLFNAAEPIRKLWTRLENKILDDFSKLTRARYVDRAEIIVKKDNAAKGVASNLKNTKAERKIIKDTYGRDGEYALKVLKEKGFSENDMKILGRVAEADKRGISNRKSVIDKILQQKDVVNEEGFRKNIRGALTEAEAALHYSGPNKQVFMNVLIKNDGTAIILKGKTSRTVGQQVDLFVVENGEAIEKNSEIIVRGGKVKLVEVKTNVGLDSEHFLPYNIEGSQLGKYKQVAKAFEKKTGIATKVELYSEGIYNKHMSNANEGVYDTFKSLKSWLEGIFFRMREEMMA